MTRPTSPWPITPFAAGAAVFGVAAALRLSLVGTARFTGDESAFWLMARAMADGEPWPLLGPPISAGQAHHPGPLFYWLMALPQLLTTAPEACNALVALVGACSVLLVWHALLRPAGGPAAFTVGMMLACSPWSALYADRIWNSNVVGLPVAGALWAALRLRENASSRAMLAFIPLCAVMPHFHMSAPVVWCALLVLAWPSIQRAPRKHVAGGLGLSVLLYVPLLVQEWRTGGGAVAAIFRETGGGGGASGAHWVPLYALKFLTLDVSWQWLTGYWTPVDERGALEFLLHGNDTLPFAWLRFLALALSVAWLGAALVCVAWQLRMPSQHPQKLPWVRPLMASACLGLVVDAVLLGVSGKPFHAHYLQPLVPLLFGVFGVLGARLAQGTRWVRVLGAVALLGVCAGGAEATHTVSSRLDARNGLATTRAVLERLHADADAAGAPADAPVNLQFGFFSVPMAYVVLSHFAYGRPLTLAAKPEDAARVYRLEPRGVPVVPGPGAFAPQDLGPVTLWRLH